MTPTLQWVFPLVLVGCAVSAPVSREDNACALLLHPPRGSYYEGVCKPDRVQLGSVLYEAWVITNYCLRLCERQLPLLDSVEINRDCIYLRHFFAEFQGCKSSNAITPGDDENISALVKELAESVIYKLARFHIGNRMICELYAALFGGKADYTEGVGLDIFCRDFDRIMVVKRSVEEQRRDYERPPVDDEYYDEFFDGDEESTTIQSSGDGSKEVNWDEWCMSQCNNGRGGNACRCDIIP